MNIRMAQRLKKIADRKARGETIRHINRQISNTILRDRMTYIKIYVGSDCILWSYLKDNIDFFKSYYIKRGFKVEYKDSLFFIDWSETNE